MFHFLILLQVWLGFPILFFVICLFLVVLPIIQRPIELGVAIGVIIIGIPVYYFAIYREDKPKWFIRFTGECSTVSFLFFLFVLVSLFFLLCLLFFLQFFYSSFFCSFSILLYISYSFCSLVIFF